MVGRMVFSSLLHRPVRTGLSILAIGVEVAMILLIAGITEGLLHDTQRRTRGVGADIVIRPSSSSAAMSLTSADIPAKLASLLKERFPEIDGLVGTTVFSQGDLQTITGVDWASFVEMCGGIYYAEGGPLENEYDAIVDDVYARYQKIRAGDTVKFLNREFRVVGVVESGKMSRVFIPLETMQELMGWEGNFSQLYIKLQDPARISAVVAEIEKLLPGYPIYPVEELLSQTAADVREMMSQFVNAIIGIAVVIGFIVVLLSMYTSIIERTREVGILKSLGASQGYIVGILMRETLVVCLLGIGLGIGLSYLVQIVVAAQFPLMPILITEAWLMWSVLLALTGSVLGTLYPAARAARHDPIQALTYH
jgi:putative ABC transport system permease protein